MKTTFWIGAAALAALAAAGCDDDRALGTEKNQDTPVVPARPAMPYEEPAVNAGKGIDIAPPAMNQATPGAKEGLPSAKEPTAEAGDLKDLTIAGHQTPFDSSQATMTIVEVQNGEDLASIPDLNEPIWAP